MTDPITLTDDNFEEQVLRSSTPVLVDYWAPWCGFCRRLGPVIDEIAVEREGALKVGKVNVDEQPHLAELAGVRGIPSVVLYRVGTPSARAVGAQPKRLLEQTLGLGEHLAARTRASVSPDRPPGAGDTARGGRAAAYGRGEGGS